MNLTTVESGLLCITNDRKFVFFFALFPLFFHVSTLASRRLYSCPYDYDSESSPRAFLIFPRSPFIKRLFESFLIRRSKPQFAHIHY